MINDQKTPTGERAKKYTGTSVILSFRETGIYGSGTFGKWRAGYVSCGDDLHLNIQFDRQLSKLERKVVAESFANADGVLNIWKGKIAVDGTEL